MPLRIPYVVRHTARRWVVEGAERWFSGGLFPTKERPLDPKSDHRPRVEAIAARTSEQDAARDLEPSDCGHDQRPHSQPEPSCLRASGACSDCLDLSTTSAFLSARQSSRRLVGASGRATPRSDRCLHLCLDRTNWKIGARDVNILMLAIATRRFRGQLMWTVLDKAGNSNSDERIALMRRYLALFGAGSVRLLLADREFIGLKWLNFHEHSGTPFAIRVKAGLLVTTQEGRSLSLQSLLAKCRGARKFHATLPRQGDVPALSLTFGFVATKVRNAT